MLCLILLEFHEVVGLGFDLGVDGVLRGSFIFVGLFLFDEVAVEFGGGEVVDDLFFEFWREAATETVEEVKHISGFTDVISLYSMWQCLN